VSAQTIDLILTMGTVKTIYLTQTTDIQRLKIGDKFEYAGRFLAYTI
jgi:hypothetical protein